MQEPMSGLTQKVQVTYLAHSGFAVEIGEKVLIFDYYEGDLSFISTKKQVYFFASHAHYDHFKRRIFQWADKCEHVRYILSDDIQAKGPKGQTLKVQARQKLKLDDLKIQTLRSTDQGVAFLVETEGIRLYHAGDLNWWHWEEEGEVYNERMRRNYQHEIRKVLEGRRIDIAFLPLDPRQQEQYSLGLDYYMRHTQTRYVFPMHMWEKHETCERFLKDPVSEDYREKVQRVTGPQQKFELKGETACR